MPNAAPPKFLLGTVVATPAALSAVRAAGQTPHEFIHRHQAGDWGDVPPGDSGLNDEAVTDGSRLLSVYTLRNGVTIWVITEAADEAGRRVCTTLLLPDDY